MLVPQHSDRLINMDSHRVPPEHQVYQLAEEVKMKMKKLPMTVATFYYLVSLFHLFSAIQTNHFLFLNFAKLGTRSDEVIRQILPPIRF